MIGALLHQHSITTKSIRWTKKLRSLYWVIHSPRKVQSQEIAERAQLWYHLSRVIQDAAGKAFRSLKRQLWAVPKDLAPLITPLIIEMRCWWVVLISEFRLQKHNNLDLGFKRDEALNLIKGKLIRTVVTAACSITRICKTTRLAQVCLGLIRMWRMLNSTNFRHS